MKVAFIVPGSGNRFYCENCMRDAALYRALAAIGQEARALPIYLPPPPEDFGGGRPYFGAVSLYFGTGLGWRLPGFFRRFLDSPPVLALAARLSGSTNPGDLGDLTLKMIAGEDAFFRAAIEPLLAALRAERPDAVILSNAMLLAFAGPIKRELGCLVACSLQDEDSWVEALPPREAALSWALMAERARAADLFIASSRWYAAKVAPLLGLSGERLAVLYPGIDVAAYEESTGGGGRTLGFLSRLSEHMGFGLLVDAFIELKKRPEFAHLRLRAAGGSTGADKAFLRAAFARARKAGVLGDIELVDARSFAARRAFLASLSVLSVPAAVPEAIGAFQLEALASGVPVVQPRHGGFPEVVEAAGGGILVEPRSVPALVEGLDRLLRDPAGALRLGREGRGGVERAFGSGRKAEELVALLEKVIQSAPGGSRV